MAESARGSLPSADSLQKAAAAAKALGDPTRLALAMAMDCCGTACVCDLSWVVDRDERLISHHARQLKAAGIARATREGKMTNYELTEFGRSLLAAVTQVEEAR